MILQSEGEEIRIPDNFEVIDRFNPAHAEVRDKIFDLWEWKNIT